MRSAARAIFLLLAASAVGTGYAEAGVKVSVRTKTYGISGTTGSALIDDMDRRGPRHGFLTRAIAQTSYSLSWTIEWTETRKSCRVSGVDGHLDITYTYPAAEALPSALKSRWSRFMSGVKRHEKVHADIARQMARAIERAVAKVDVPNDPGCRKARSETRRLMSSISQRYEARQVSYDAREHRDGGPVERLLGRLKDG
ncbi:MAG: DUF922 domain-containing protein [Rhizobiaceae bacterium]|nr:DUF922 domain-containing protein [Rhizobiaceae bacterium]